MYQVVFATVHSNLTLSPAAVLAVVPVAPNVLLVLPRNTCWPAAWVNVQDVAPAKTTSMIVPTAAVAGKLKLKAPPGLMQA